MRHYLKNTLVFILGFTVIGAFGQEYDDLYFTKKDRKKKKQVEVAMTDPANESREYIGSDFQSDQSDEDLSFLGRQFKETNPHLEGVSEESLDYYKPEKTQEDYINAEQQEQQNPNFSNPQSSVHFNDGSVYDNNGNFSDANGQQPVIINNYYNDNWNTWNRWNRPGLNVGFGWNSWGGNFWSVSYGNAWGNPWYDPFWDPWWGWNAWGPRWGWNTGWAWNAGWGWGGIYDPYWCAPYRGIYNRPVYVVGSDRRGRNVVRGARNSRGSVATRSSRSSSGRRSGVASEGNVSSRQVNYNRQQADYLNRSRSNTRYNSNTSRGAETINSRASSRSSIFNNSNNSRSNTNSSFSRPSTNTRSRSYTPPASSRGSSNRSYTPSRSSSSRSSGSVSRGRSSSSRSSGSRSSSGRSSSGRRGGN
ncbi:hypothetical protein [Ekhidna sp.]|uniref:hypothetical protein n=1 Tax=Ekhidna sp. TaxID=2608089 RepID=UPI003CCC2126